MFWESTLSNVLGTIAGGIFLSLTFFYLRERLFAVPDLSGVWILRAVTDYSSYPAYDSLQVFFRIAITQGNGRVTGAGEKIYELSTAHRYNFLPADRTQVSVEGTVEARIFGAHRVNLAIREFGQRRPSVTSYRLSIIRESGCHVLEGEWQSTVANSHGTALIVPNAIGFPCSASRLTVARCVRNRVQLALASLFFREEWERVKPKAIQAWRTFIRFEQCMRSETLSKLLIAGEDRRHSAHVGFDALALPRIAKRAITSRQIEGGSTIEQQFVRALHGDYRRTLRRKCKDIALAIRLQSVIPKRHVVGAYLMVAHFGPNLIGAMEASTGLGLSCDTATNEQLAQLVARVKYPAPAAPNARQLALIEGRANWLLRHVPLPSSPPASRN